LVMLAVVEFEIRLTPVVELGSPVGQFAGRDTTMV